MVGMDYRRLAARYDTYVTTTFDIPFFLKEVQGRREVLELMSGTGRLSIPLLEAGVRLTCVDYSPDMLAVLRRKLEIKGLAATIIESNVARLALPQKYDLALLPFHSFAELLIKEDQEHALMGICDSLAEAGRFICTLHNPASRLKSCDGALRLRGEFPLDEQAGALWGLDSGGTLLLWGVERYDPHRRTVSGIQQYEIYDQTGVMRSKEFLNIQFVLHGRNDFEQLAQTAGFRTAAVFGDYARTEFREESSSFMIWVLEKHI
jgi:SAM-dependent methyltransferase